MIGISIATKWEYEATLEYFRIKKDECFNYPYGEYFMRTINDSELVFYSTGVRKVNGVGGNQYMISKFNLTKVIVAGTCAGIDDTFTNLDIFVPHKAVQCKKNDVECIIIKGISDFPTDERNSDKFKSNKEQISVYLENTPKVMNKIFGDYLKRFI
ncbi:hypothetical protein [Fictibacillus phosphorivorans]|uniref:5'-methylthioadenosine/S-adenosylhomocysteine nucleosidase family protein n=1 Tax=Fictibacillus phosphorivorans TaxID=1221500 RepID=UPI0011A3233E|nr:hypothetical protein [Fictibacillus phosphorivorans]